MQTIVPGVIIVNRGQPKCSALGQGAQLIACTKFSGGEPKKTRGGILVGQHTNIFSNHEMGLGGKNTTPIQVSLGGGTSTPIFDGGKKHTFLSPVTILLRGYFGRQNTNSYKADRALQK